MAEKRKNTILNFFQKKSKVTENNERAIIELEKGNGAEPQPQVSLPSGSSSTKIESKYDIGNYIGKELDRTTKLDILKNLWVPDSQFEFPVTVQQGKNRHFKYIWMHQYNWLIYSQKADGALCKFCVFFAPIQAGVCNQKLGALVRNPYKNWKNALEDFRGHESKTYHKNAVIEYNDFLQLMAGKRQSVDVLLDTEKQKQILENRKRLIPIIEAVILCGRQELPLRGHRDSGRLNIDLNQEDQNQGNFRAILAFRARGDPTLNDLLQGPGERNKYMSPIIQNEIIDSCNDVIIGDIVRRINKSQAFSVLADETADIAGTEQLSIGAKYFDKESMVMREDFLKFLPVTDLTGQGLAKALITELKELGIDINYLRGQGYDGASSMAGSMKGVQAIIAQEHKMAPYVHCMGHAFNLVVSNACTIPAIRNAMGNVQEVRNFFISPKRKAILNENIAKGDTQAKSLKYLCQTRWIERFHAVDDFLELFDPVIDSLSIIMTWIDKATSRDASALINCILNPEFVIAILAVEHLFSYALPLSKYLQKADIDLASALKHADNLMILLRNMRSDANAVFKKVFQKAHNICEKHSINITFPRLAKKQLHRPNVKVDDVEDYYRISLFIPFLDTFITALDDKFAAHRTLFEGFSCLIPLMEVSQESNKIEYLHDYYKEDGLLGTKVAVQAELSLWHQTLRSEYTKHNTPLPKNAVDGLIRCDETLFPNIRRMLQLLATLPVSTASSERSFSTLKRLKTYLRNTIGQNRLNGLAVLSVHRKHEIDAKRILDHLAHKKNRRIALLL